MNKQSKQTKDINNVIGNTDSIIKISSLGTGEIAQRVRMFAALLGDPSLVRCAHIRELTAARDPTHLASLAAVLMHTYNTYAHANN